jgi:hypothetical protein
LRDRLRKNRAQRYHFDVEKFVFNLCPLTEEEQHVPWNICGAMTDGAPNLSPTNERLVPGLLRGRGRSIGADLDVGEEGSEQTIVTLQSLHHDSVGYQHVCTRVGLAKKAKFL